MTCAEQFDVQITGAGETHGLICDWNRGGAGIRIPKPESLSSTAVSTKGDFGVRDVDDFYRVIQSDWSEGCLQKTFDRQDDSENAFWDSRNIDVSSRGEFKLGPHRAQANYGSTVAAIISARSGGATRVYRGLSIAPYVQYSTDGTTWTDIASVTPMNDAVVSLATDGHSVVVVDAAYHLWAGVYTLRDFGVFTGLTHVAFASGVFYGTKGLIASTAQIGYFDKATTPWKWNALSPAISTAINLYGATFGLVPCGNEVFWGITNGMTTKVYRALRTGTTTNSITDDYINEVCTLPTGFVGLCMHSYGKTVYIGGYYDSWASATTGIGAIYALEEETIALLTDVGFSVPIDNRVLSITTYGKYLYFWSDRSIWRWNLVLGGYSHYGGPYTATYPTDVEITSGKDAVWANIAAVGSEKTTPDQYFNAEDGRGYAYMMGSVTSGNMPTVDKYFDSITVELAEANVSPASLQVDVIIDGTAHNALFLDTARSTTTKYVYTIGVIGRRIQHRIWLVTPAVSLAATPYVAEVATLFTPMPKSTRTYTYFVRCWESVESRIKDVLWQENAQLVSAWLEAIANTVVTVERPGMPSYVGKIDNVEYLEAPPSRRANGREGLYQLDIRWLA